MKSSSAHQQLTNNCSGQKMILNLKCFITSPFLKGLDLFYVSNGESLFIRAIGLEMTIALAFETFLPFQLLFGFIINSLCLERALMEVAIVLVLGLGENPW